MLAREPLASPTTSPSTLSRYQTGVPLSDGCLAESLRTELVYLLSLSGDVRDDLDIRAHGAGPFNNLSTGTFFAGIMTYA